MKLHIPISVLVTKYILGNATDTEIKQLEEWASLSEKNRRLLNRFNDPAFILSGLEQRNKINMTERKKDLQKRLLKRKQKEKTAKVIRLYSTRTCQTAGLIIIGLSLWLLYKRAFPTLLTPPAPIAQVTKPQQQPHAEPLITTHNKIQKTNKENVTSPPHHSSGSATPTQKSSAIQTDSMNVPPYEQQAHYTSSNNEMAPSVSGASPQNRSCVIGRRMVLRNKELPDKSTLTLNAGSTLLYPHQFSGDNRKITLTGEAYVRVRKEDAFPFLVTSGMVSVETTGADFNIRSYPDEEETIIIAFAGNPLLVCAGPHMSTLQAGQRAVIKKGAAICIDNIIDTEKVLAYTNKVFRFQNDNINMVGKELSHWYERPLVGSCMHNVGFTFIGLRKLKLEDLLNSATTTDNKQHLKAIGNQLVLE